MTDVGNGMLNPLPGEPPAEPPATPGTVTVLLTIPWERRVDDEPAILETGRMAREALRLFGEAADVVAFHGRGFNINDIDITKSEFVPDQDPGGEG